MATDVDPTTRWQNEMASSMQHYWDETAECYASYELFNQNDPQREAWMALLARVLPPDRPLDVLDVGCGSGFVAIALAELGHRVVGLDISPGMLQVARRDAEARGLDLELVVAPGEQPPPGIGPFDAVVSRHVLWTLPWPEQAVRAWAELTRPGGRVVAVDSLWSPELIREMDEKDYPPEVTRFLPLIHARDLEPTRNVWRRCGLADVMVERIAWLDEVLRAESPSDAAMMYRELTFYLVEGTVATRSPGA